MTSIPNHFGPGPEKITNEWLNQVMEALLNQQQTLRVTPNLVIYGGLVQQVVEEQDLFLSIQGGRCNSFGQVVDFPSRTLSAEIPSGMEGASLYYMWVYIDEKGELVKDIQTAPLWPRYTDDQGQEHDLTVLSLDLFQDSGTNGLEWVDGGHNDLRRFSRTYSNAAVLVVGDLNAGADFETIQQALDYLAAADEAGKAVPRNVLVTTDQEVTEPIQVKCTGVVLAGVKARTQVPEGEQGPPPPPGGEQQITEPTDEDGAVKITWTYKGDGTLSQSAIIDAGGFQDLDVRNLHFEHRDTDPWCYIHNPGDGFRLQGCEFGVEGVDSPVSVVVNFSTQTTRVEVTDNKVLGVRRGLFGYEQAAPEGGKAPPTSACLARSSVQKNYVSVVDVTDWPVDVPTKLFFAIDMGLGAGETGCVYNVVRDNVIDGCFCGIRQGRVSTVHANTVLGCRHLGIVVTSTGPVPPAGPQEMGVTEVRGNGVELVWYDGAPWWRAGIRLEVTDCHVGGNTVVVGSQGGCGVVHAPLDMSQRSDMLTEMAALRDGRHTVVGNNIVMTGVDGRVRHDLTDTRQGIGVALVSVGNRVSANGIYHARTGILVMAGSTVCDNVVSPAVVGIFAWSGNTVSGNVLGWLPHTSPGLPWTLAEYVPTGAVLVSNDNVCDGNTIRCGTEDASGQEPPAAVSVDDWPTRIFGDEWASSYQTAWENVPVTEAPLQVGLIGRAAGGNVVSDAIIDLANPGGILGSPSGSFRVDGIVMACDEGRSNTVSGVTVRTGRRGVVATGGRVEMTGCSVFYSMDRCVDVAEAPGSGISGCLLFTGTGQPVRIDAGSPDTRLDDCLVMRTLSSAATSRTTPVAIDLAADRVHVCDCAIVNQSSVAIAWSGSFGVCSGCWFSTRNPTVDWDPSTAPYQPDGFYPAIRYCTQLDAQQNNQPATQGNLVTGAHMLNCSPQDPANFDSPIEWLNAQTMDVTPAPPATPPKYDTNLQRWESMVALLTCYYRDPSGAPNQ